MREIVRPLFHERMSWNSDAQPMASTSPIDAQRPERLHRVGRQIDPGADLAMHRRLLANDDLGAATLERQRRGQSANAASDDNDAWHAWHFRWSPRYCATL